MLDFSAILTASGLLLWQYNFTEEADVLSGISSDVFAGDGTSIEVAGSRIQWVRDPTGRLIFLVRQLGFSRTSADAERQVGTPRVLESPRTYDLLRAMRRDFMAIQDSNVTSVIDATSGAPVSHLSRPRHLIRQDWLPLFRSWEPTFLSLAAHYSDSKLLPSRPPSACDEAVITANESAASSSTATDDTMIARNIAALRNRRGRPQRPVSRSSDATSRPGSAASNRKDARKWDGQDTGPTGDLDFSSSIPPAGDDATLTYDHSSMGTRGRHGEYHVAEYSDQRADAASTVARLFGRLAETVGLGSQILSEQSLAPALLNMQDLLMKKNVAREIAQDLCNSVGRDLSGRQVGALQGGVAVTVQRAMEAALTERLTPKASNDILADAKLKSRSRADAKPYVIVFVGVNGVGKSTNLSKVAFWLLQNHLRVLVAACDTFRSGAVEQLRTHVRNLARLDVNSASGKSLIELYERGYGKDAAGIAKDAIEHAHREQYDVVLVDTAGRMQDNEPLMRSLAKTSTSKQLVNVNNPDKVLFVGEALVGNEAVDQLGRFDRSLKSFSGLGGRSRGIDGIILTKFDTIDDKVGAAVSMACTTGCPVVFIGTGQTYSDLRTLRVASIVTALMR